MYICSLLLSFVVLAPALEGNVPAELLDAIEQVESSGRGKVKGDKGKAVGAYQIHPITVEDANRILGRGKYTLLDRYNREKSREMCAIILWHYERGKGFAAMARRWNGGTGWRNKPSTVVYWGKVQKEMALRKAKTVKTVKTKAKQ